MKKSENEKQCHFWPFFATFDPLKKKQNVILGFDGKGCKRENMIALFSPLAFIAANFWKRRARAKQDLDTAVITRSLSSLWIGTSLSKRRVSKATTPSTNEKRQQSKPSFPMIRSRVTLAFTREIEDLKIHTMSVPEATFQNIF